MKARHYFEALGRSYRSRGLGWSLAKAAVGLHSLPKFAQEAFARGHLLQGPIYSCTVPLNSVPRIAGRLIDYFDFTGSSQPRKA